MSISPLEYSSSLRIGAVEFVSPDEIKVALDLESPDGMAANAGVPRPFPRINSYVVISTEIGLIVSQVEWISVERSSFPKRKGFQDYGLVDLPFPLRKMKVSPLGVLKTKQNNFIFNRGVNAFPSIGEPVLIPTDKQLKAIVESGKNRRVKIGTSPTAANAEVCVDPDRLFGRHLAVLGNTGSGKSCSVAGLIQWSLKAAKQAKENKDKDKDPNARFIIFDPNGEYSKIFRGKGRIFKVGDKTNPLQVPLWFWNSSEWCSFTQASAKAQAPLLKRTLRTMRNEDFTFEEDIKIEIKKFLKSILNIAKQEKNKGSPWGTFPQPRNFYNQISKWNDSLTYFANKNPNISDKLSDILYALNCYITKRSGNYPNFIATYNEIANIIDKIKSAFNSFGGTEKELLPKNEDIPTPFEGENFINNLHNLAHEQGYEQYVDFLLTRIRTILADTRMNTIIDNNSTISLEDWLNKYIGRDGDENGCVTIIDLSLVPSEIIHIVTAVISRMVFEALQRYRKLNHRTLPTSLVVEEAHTFVKRYKDDSDYQNTSTICCQIFEKISREGRKFGLGLILSSQRPSELSSTVLSQCNTFLLHRISNDRDQELVQRLVPDNLRGLLRELPSLPSQQAILLGWATELPIIVEMNDLADHERPQSDDPNFWEVWSQASDNDVDWEEVAKDWQQRGNYGI